MSTQLLPLTTVNCRRHAHLYELFELLRKSCTWCKRPQRSQKVDLLAILMIFRHGGMFCISLRLRNARARHTAWSFVQLPSPSEKRVGWIGGWALSSWPPSPGCFHNCCWGSRRRCAYWPQAECPICSFTIDCHTVEPHKAIYQTLTLHMWPLINSTTKRQYRVQEVGKSSETDWGRRYLIQSPWLQN